MSERYFDLNIEKVLDNWEVYHAVREIIANALDETLLTGCRKPEFVKDGEGFWHVRDYGRGLNYEHFTQNQNSEKVQSSDVIGKFGVGLKDALAVLDRAGRSVVIDSKYAHNTLAMHRKEGFDDVQTLHAVFADSLHPDFEGTEFTLQVTDKEVQDAKKLFLYFEEKTPLDITSFGEIYQKGGQSASIYVNGVKVADEENYTFDYNITKKNAALKKALNRERSAVGRTAYSATIKSMLLNSSTLEVISVLLSQLKKIPEGTQGDEINYMDVQAYAIKKYNALKPTVFMSSLAAYDLTEDDKEKIRDSGRELVIVPDAVFDRVKNEDDENGDPIGTFDVVRQEYNDNFEYDWVEDTALTAKQQQNWKLRTQLLEYLELSKWDKRIKLSKTINEYTSGDVRGVYDSQLKLIVLKPAVLSSAASFYETLIHELVHATTGYSDNTRDFENALGKYIGKLAVDMFAKQKNGSLAVEKTVDSASMTKADGFFRRLFKK
ncbi:ATP-binding protein [Sporolactobacillus kofuensis]|uniref:ATP-binding protein n=1 Tax=Sporolactobacillus kofuensis TaxID=269672 RepID=A0ABW1WDG1_9BACL|nr:ATP-binding protein [Sporolactobacillus kofuensis]MCO7175473.1 ATP-binding protein [Sporolactobacillus kofuensis]